MTEQSERVKQHLLPNEEIRLICPIRDKSLILSNRRLVIANDTSIELAMSYDCGLNIAAKRGGRFEVSGRVVDQNGKFTDHVQTFEIRGPKGSSQAQFQSTMNECSEIVDELRACATISPAPVYLERMPESLTNNAILDLNTVLRDQPIHDKLVHEASQFLGEEPFLIEESLRDGDNRENGVMFAAGTQGYYWIQGVKEGRFMSNVIVDTVEWENFRGFTHLWHNDSPIIHATYSLTKDGKLITKDYLWSPPVNDDTIQYPWLLQEWNGPWILSDVWSKYTRKLSYP